MIDKDTEVSNGVRHFWPFVKQQSILHEIIIETINPKVSDLSLTNMNPFTSVIAWFSLCDMQKETLCDGRNKRSVFKIHEQLDKVTIIFLLNNSMETLTDL